MKPTKKQLLHILPDVAINALTQAQATRYMKWCHKEGKKWIDGEKATDGSTWGIGYWKFYGKESCYDHNNWMNGKGTTDDKQYFLDRGYTVITVPEFFKIINNERT